MTDQATPDVQEPLRFEREYVTGPEYPARVTNALYRYAYLRPTRLARWIVPVVIYLAVITLLVFNQQSEDRIVTNAFILIVAIVLFLTVFGYFRARKKIADQIPVGTKFSIGFKDETLVIRGPFISSEISYRAFTTVLQRGDFVFLTLRATKRASAYPGQLFTPESLAWLASKVTR